MKYYWELNMKSSSELFPAQLIKADVFENNNGGFTEDVYLIKPNNNRDKSVQIAVTNLSKINSIGEFNQATKNEKKSWWQGRIKNKAADSRSIILLHGCYQNRNLWFSPEHSDLIDQLLEKGFDVWLMEHRGHGMSPINTRYNKNTLEDYARYDIPAVNDFVTEHTNSKPHWIGYGEGAGALLFSLACDLLDADAFSSITGIGSPFLSLPMSRMPLSHLLAKPFNRSQEFSLRRGPESEPWALRKQLLKEGGWLNQRGSNLGVNLWDHLLEKNHPIRWLASQADLIKLDEGLEELFKANKLELLDCSLSWEALAPENVHSTLLTSVGAEHLLHSLTDKLESFVNKHGVILAHKAVS
jgi:pimeloyl-ACP methyl ester carboxylesterase